MKKNMSSTDRIIRLALAALIAALYYFGTISGTFGIIALVIAAVFLLTSLVGFCPLYTLLGISTCPRRS